MTDRPEIVDASDRSLLVIFGQAVTLALHRRVAALLASLRQAPPEGLVNLHPGYASLLVSYDPRLVERPALRRELERRLAGQAGAAAPPSRLVTIPVCYGGGPGPDLDVVSRHTGLPPAEVIARHSGAEYLVYFLGFSPGFPYLGGLPPELATPRRDTPRVTVPAGSVAIGHDQTGIYPLASPGGWQVIGRTPLRLFDPAADPPSRLMMGDRIRFRSIPEEEFMEWSHASNRTDEGPPGRERPE